MKILLFIGKSNNSLYVANSVISTFRDVNVIMEEPPSRNKLLKRRMKKLGLPTVLGQLLFMTLEKFLLYPASRNRISKLRSIYQLNNSQIDNQLVINVETINDISVIKEVKRLNPDIIIVNGTRIISKKIIDSVSVPMINIHVGITPQYRGVHGAYWALYNNDIENCGVTIHQIDTGIDTGSVICQKNIHPESEDNFTTYPTMQYGVIIPELIDLLFKFEKTRSISTAIITSKISRLYSHPTIFQYVKGYFRGVK